MRVAPSLAFYGSDPMHLLRVPLLYIQYCTCLLHPFNELSGSVDYMKKSILLPVQQVQPVLPKRQELLQESQVLQLLLPEQAQQLVEL